METDDVLCYSTHLESLVQNVPLFISIYELGEYLVEQIRVAARSNTCMNFLPPLEHWGHRFESHSGHKYLCAFIQ